MKRNGVILMLILLCVAFLVSCAKRENTETADKGELVRTETMGNFPWSLCFCIGLTVCEWELLLTGKNGNIVKQRIFAKMPVQEKK